MHKGNLFLIGVIIILFTTSACDISKPEPESEFEGIPGPEFSIPDSLISTEVPGRVTRGDAQNVFEPFRAGLGFAQWGVDFVSLIIAGLNDNPIPESGEFVSDGELVVITTEPEREYETIIEFYTGETAVAENKYMQISYTKDINKGEAVLDVGTKYPEIEDVDRLKIYYDGTGNQPVLKGWLTFNYDIADVFIVYPISVYFNAVFHIIISSMSREFPLMIPTWMNMSICLKRLEMWIRIKPLSTSIFRRKTYFFPGLMIGI